MPRVILLALFFISAWKTPCIAQDLQIERSLEIQSIKEHWRAFTEIERKNNPDFFFLLDSSIKTGNLELSQAGSSGIYFLHDLNNDPSFVLKPVDEAIFCLNNPKGFSSYLKDYRAKKDIPSYTSVQREAASYRIAQLLQVDTITPITLLGILSHSTFYTAEENNDLKEKLCSIQPYVKNSLPITDLLQHFFFLGLSEKEIEQQFDHEDFENICLFLWVTYDNDANPPNFLTYVKKVDEQNLPIYGIQKIDNGQTFPEKNRGLSSFFWSFPHAENELSEKILNQIANIPLEEIKKTLALFSLEASFPSLEERVLYLQQITKKKITYNKAYKKLQKKFTEQKNRFAK